MKRQRLLLPLVLLLVASHCALFFIAAQAGKKGDAGKTSGGGQLPAKTSTRSKSMARDGEAKRFTQLLRELEESPMAYAEFEVARRELFREWLRRDLRSALDQLYSPLLKERQEKLSASLEDEIHEAIARQAREVWAWIEARDYGSLTPEMHDLWLEAVLGDGQSELAIELLPNVPEFAIEDFVDGICEHATAAELAKVREFLGSPQAKSADHKAMVADYAERVVKLPGADAAKLLAAEDDPAIRSNLAECWTERELSYLPGEAAVSGVAALPPDVRGAALVVLANGHRRGGSTTAAALLQEMDAQGLLTSLPQEHLDDVLYWCVSVRVDDEAVPLAESMAPYFQIARPELRRAAIEQISEGIETSFGDRSLTELLEGLPQIPASPDRDVLLAAVAKQHASSRYFSPAGTFDEQALPTLLAAISEPELRAKVEGEIEEREEEEEE